MRSGVRLVLSKDIARVDPQSKLSLQGTDYASDQEVGWLTIALRAPYKEPRA